MADERRNEQSRLEQKVVMSAVSVTQNSTAYSDSLDFEGCEGEICVLITSSAGSITVTQQCSTDGTNWYSPVDYANAALGAVAATMTVSTRYIAYSPVLCKKLRFKVVEGNVAGTVVTITAAYRSRRRN